MCVCVCVVDYDTASLEVQKRLEADVSEDTDCDGSSLPEDSPEVQRFSFLLWPSSSVIPV